MQQPPRYAAFCCIWWGLLLLFYDRRDKESVVVAVELQHGGKGLTGQGDAAELAAVKAVAEALGDTGRILVRESGTEPVVRVMVEAPDHDTCQKYVSQVVDVIKAQGYSV